MKHCISCLIYYFLYPRWLFLCSGRFECEESPLPSYVLPLATLSWLRVINLVPRAFPSIFLREKPWGRGCRVISSKWRAWSHAGTKNSSRIRVKVLFCAYLQEYFHQMLNCVSLALYQSLRPCLYAETFRLEGSPAYPSYSVRATTTKRGELFTWETKSWLGSPFGENTLVRPAGWTRSLRWDNQSTRDWCFR